MKTKNYKNIKKEEFKNYNLLSSLLNINQIPKELNFIGNENLLNSNAKILCIVGSRKATTYGKEVTDYLVRGLQNKNIIIVSGLAMGIDSAAHKAAMRYNIPTISFPGSGLDDDVIYPAINLKLKNEIINSGGALVSEYENDKKSEIYFFPARNRLMAAVSDLILVVEAEEKSGTQITARLALEYGKDVAIVPGSIFSAYSRGTAQLFKDGAHPVTSSDDILQLLNLKSNEQNSLFENIDGINNYLENNLPNEKDENGKITSMSGAFGATHKNTFSSLSPNEKIILSLLNSPLDKDTLIENSNLAAHEALIAITSLESKNMILDNFGEIKKII